MYTDVFVCFHFCLFIFNLRKQKAAEVCTTVCKNQICCPVSTSSHFNVQKPQFASSCEAQITF